MDPSSTTYTTVRGKRAESYRRAQNRQYRAKIRQLQPPRQRVYPPSQADTLPLATVHQIIDEYKQGVSLNKLSTKHGISRYILTKVLKKHNDTQKIFWRRRWSTERPLCPTELWMCHVNKLSTRRTQINLWNHRRSPMSDRAGNVPKNKMSTQRAGAKILFLRP